MTVLTGGEAIVSGLKAHGIDTVFGLPGAQGFTRLRHRQLHQVREDHAAE